MKKSTVTRVAGAASIALGLAISLGVPAQGATAAHKGHGGGTCSADSTIKFAVTEKHDMLKVKAKIATGVAGELWDWSISDNGTTVAADETATDSAGKLVVHAKIDKLDGANTVDFTATDTVTGETCTAEAVIDG